MDLQPGYPPPPLAPIGLTVSSGNATVVLAGLSVIAVLGLGWVVADGLRNRNVLFLAVFLGGLATSLLEPFADLLGFVWFPPVDQVPAFTMLGIPIPLFVVIGYLCLFGLMPWVMVVTMRAGTTKRRFWAVSSAMLLGACVFEWILLRSGTYLYYGNQPLQVWGYPLIWMTINSGACLITAAVLYRFPRFFTGPRALAAVVLTPCADGAIMLGTGWPSFAGIHSDLPSPVVSLLGVVTIGLGLAVYAVVAELVCTDGRLRPPAAAAPAPHTSAAVR